MIVRIAALICIATAVATAQAPESPEPQRERPLYGVLFGAGLNEHTADFQRLPNVPSCCPQYRSGSGLGLQFGGFYEIAPSPLYHYGLRVSLASASAKLVSHEFTTLIDSAGPFQAPIDHTIDASIWSFGVEPYVSRLISASLRAQLGLRLGLVTGASFTQTELLASGGTWKSGSVTRNDTSGKIPNASSFAASLTVGVRYELPLNATGSLSALPEISASYGLTPVIGGYAWHAHSIRGGISLAWKAAAPTAAPPPVETPPPPPPVPVPPPVIVREVSPEEEIVPLRLTMEAFAVDSSGVEHPGTPVRMEEFVATQMYPLLTYIFFDEQSATLPSKLYRMLPGQVDRFRLVAARTTNGIELYRDVLNVLGSRMRASSDERITLTGCTMDAGGETGDTSLSRRRAEAVRDYLRDYWKIDPARISIVVRNAPEHPSAGDDDDARAENRRVEISSSRGFDPVILSDTIRTTSSPRLRFKSRLTAKGTPKLSWDMRLQSEGRDLKREGKVGSPPENYDLDLSTAQQLLALVHGSVDARLEVDGPSVATATATASIPFDVVTIQHKREEGATDKSIDEYRLILFDFDRADLTAAHHATIAFIRSRLKRNSIVTITGHTDNVGDEEYNRKLSELRARAVAAALGLPAGRAQGVGADSPPCPNNVPEGRFYNRTVDVRIETPME